MGTPLGLFVVGVFLLFLGWLVQSNIVEWLLDILGIIIIIAGVIVIIVAIVTLFTGRNKSSRGY